MSCLFELLVLVALVRRFGGPGTIAAPRAPPALRFAYGIGVTHAPPLRPPSPEPFILDGGDVGVLLVHGFGGSPSEVRRLAEYLHEGGVTVSVPLLPGHGTEPSDLDGCTYHDWIEHAHRALEDLRSRCDTVFVGGLSVGAAIGVHLVVHSGPVAGFLAYAPALLSREWTRNVLPILRLILLQFPKPSQDIVDPRAKDLLWSYPGYSPAAGREVLRLVRVTSPLLPRVRCPLLVVRSGNDRTVPPAGGRFLYEAAATHDKELVTLHRSGHVVTIDREWREVAERSWRFVRSRSPDEELG